MPKYRFLSDEELKGFEDEFKQFLIANGLHKEEWEAMNKNDPDKAIDIVGLFSDLILDKVYDKTEFVLHCSDKQIMAFKFTKEKALLLAVEYKGDDVIDTERPLEFIKNNASEMLIYGTSKTFNASDRNKEVNLLVQGGAVASDNSVFDFLAEIKKD